MIEIYVYVYYQYIRQMERDRNIWYREKIKHMLSKNLLYSAGDNAWIMMRLVTVVGARKVFLETHLKMGCYKSAFVQEYISI